MSTRNWNHQRKNSIKYTVKTASATLTKAELDHGFIVGNHGTVAIALALPSATSLYKGVECRIANKGAANVTVVVATTGFGGGAGGADTVTLTQGDMAIISSDGAYWYSVPAAA